MAVIVFFNNIATVIGPTPPGTGVAKDALLIDDRSSDDHDNLANAGSSDTSESGEQSSVEAPEIATASEGDTNADILKAAFAEGADDDDTPH